MPASTAQEALDLAALQPPDAAIVDLVLPDGDGIEVTRALREWTKAPIIVLSAIGEEDRRSARWRRAPTTTSRSRSARASSSRACTPRCAGRARRRTSRCARRGPRARSRGPRVRVDGEEVHLTPIEFEPAGALMTNRGRLLTHRALLVEVWGPAYADDTATLRTHIANLRRKIEPGRARRD